MKNFAHLHIYTCTSTLDAVMYEYIVPGIFVDLVKHTIKGICKKKMKKT